MRWESINTTWCHHPMVSRLVVEKVGFMILSLILCATAATALVATVNIPVAAVTTENPLSLVSPFITGPNLLLSLEANTQGFLAPAGLQKDQVVRVLDANTLKLKKNGVVTLAGVRMPTPGSGNFQFPECLTYTPAYKLRQLVPANTEVYVKVGSTASAGKSIQAVVVRTEDSVLVNRELVRTGFGKVQKVTSSDLMSYLDTDDMQNLQARAKEQGVGIFQRCDVEHGSEVFEAQFEPLEVTVETQWGDDGGKMVTRQREMDPTTPANPGDIKGCSDFVNYEDALRWYESYFPFYGDVAKLDRDGDGVPCPGLPHTKVAEKYRMKVPTAVKQ